MSDKTNFRGTPIYLAGRYFIIPPLSVGQMEEYEAEQKAAAASAAASGDPAPTGSGPTISLIQKALSRNYGDEITGDWLRDNIDAATLREAIAALSALSGLTAVAPGE